MIPRWNIRVAVLLFSCCLSTGARAEIRKLELPLSTDAVTAYTAPDSSTGDYYVVTFDVPVGVRDSRIMSAVLEFYVDASATSIDGWVNETPVIELYALKEPISEDLDLNAIHEQSAAVEPVVIGEKRRVVLDVTGVVQSWVQDPALNHGLILGSFRGTKEGVFSLCTDPLGGGEIARVTILYEMASEGTGE